MGGLDWEGVRARYRPLVQNLGSHDDLVDLLWEMHGELGTSHAYVTPAPVTEPGSGGQGFLGADLRPGPGGWEVVRILGAESSDPQATSPLSAPGADVHAGDIIAAVDGQPVPPREGPAALLTGAAGRAVELTIVSTDGGGAPVQRRIAVVPLRSEERLRYQNWVSANRRIVREASGGTFGYLHIPDMVANGWSQLHRDLDQEASLQALVVDVRRNRGGHTSQLVAELIGRKVTAWENPRGGKPTPYPAHAPRGPVVILTDEFAGSDGDIITQTAKLRSIGPVVGTRTWGGVVGIDGRFRLVDGTVVQPAAVRVLVYRRCGLGRGEPRRRAGHRGGVPAARIRGRRRPAAGARRGHPARNAHRTAHGRASCAVRVPLTPAGSASPAPADGVRAGGSTGGNRSRTCLGFRRGSGQALVSRARPSCSLFPRIRREQARLGPWTCRLRPFSAAGVWERCRQRDAGVASKRWVSTSILPRRTRLSSVFRTARRRKWFRRPPGFPRHPTHSRDGVSHEFQCAPVIPARGGDSARLCRRRSRCGQP
nr:PDZ domain-containing protein [Arthrobacter sp. ATA002]